MTAQTCPRELVIPARGMAEGFEVDLKVLNGAVEGIDSTVEAMGQCEVADICGPPAEYGNEILHGAFENFCDEWQEGIELLLEDAETISKALKGASKTYHATDDEAANSFAAGARSDVGGVG